MSNVPHIRISAKEKVYFGIAHTILWCAAFVLTICVIIAEKMWFYFFLIYVEGLEIYIGIKTYRDGKQELEKKKLNEGRKDGPA